MAKIEQKIALSELEQKWVLHELSGVERTKIVDRALEYQQLLAELAREYPLDEGWKLSL